MKRILLIAAIAYCGIGNIFGQYETPRIPIGEINDWVQSNGSWIALEPRWMLDAHKSIQDTSMLYGSTVNGLDNNGKFSLNTSKRWENLSEYEKRHYLLRDNYCYATSWALAKKENTVTEYYFTGAFRNLSHYKKDTDAFVAKIESSNGTYKVLWIKYISKKNQSEENTFEYGMKAYNIGGNCIVSIYRLGFENKNLLTAFGPDGEMLWEIESPDLNKDFWNLVPFNEEGTQFIGLGDNLDRYGNINQYLSLIVVETTTGKIIKQRKIKSQGYPGCIWKYNNSIYAAINFRQFFCEDIKTTLTASSQTNTVVFKLNKELDVENVYVYLSEEPFMVNDVKIYSDGIMMTGLSGERLNSLAYYHPSDPNLPNAKTFGLVIDSLGEILNVTSKYEMVVKKY